ncbi:MAG: hypothetical protein L0312_24070 [Acidobacteria bacterium]|nr:hypothetical protein [Acidobacteriota bacterium]
MNPRRKLFPRLFKRTGAGGTQEWDIQVESTTEGHGVLVVRYGLSDGKKQELRETIKQGKNVGRKNETTPYEQAILEAESRWKRQKERKGYGLTARESAQVRAISPMLAQDFRKRIKEIDWSNACAQPKLDGFRCLATKVRGRVLLRSREHKPIITMMHVAEELEHVLDEGMIFDGELYCHGIPFERLASGIRKLGDQSEDIDYHVYDLISSASFEERAEELRSRVAGYDSIYGVETIRVRSADELMVCQRRFLEEGYEGAMLRHGSTGYEAGKRSKHLLKVKTFQDAEFVVADAKQGRGTHAGMAIFVCVTNEGHPFDVLAPGTHSAKIDYWLNWEKYVGKKLTVKFFDYTKTEEPVPRFPVAVRFSKK